MVPLSTGRLELRPLAVGDLDELVALDADPDVMRFITGGRPRPRSEAAAKYRAAAHHRWVARTPSEDRFVGWFGLRPSATGEREIGYRLCRGAWGQGFATEGSIALLRYAFGDLGLDRVWGQTMAVNQRSRRVMERCGMSFVRTFHLDWQEPIQGTEHGEVEYEMRRRQAEQAGILLGHPDRA